MPSFTRTVKDKIKRKLEYIKLQNSGNYRHLEKDISLKKKWLGNDYGGFYVATEFLVPGSTVYSFGIGEDISFDSEIIGKYNVNVFGFDFTPKSVQWISSIKLPENFKFIPQGISNFSGKTTFYLPKNPDFVSGSVIHHSNVNPETKIEVEVKTLSDFTQELGHERIDILKMDIEGSEYEVLENILPSNVEIGQILVEFHDRFFPDGKEKTIKTVHLLKSKGFLIFGVSETFDEVSFINKNLIKK